MTAELVASIDARIAQIKDESERLTAARKALVGRASSNGTAERKVKFKADAKVLAAKRAEARAAIKAAKITIDTRKLAESAVEVARAHNARAAKAEPRARKARTGKHDAAIAAAVKATPGIRVGKLAGDLNIASQYVYKRIGPAGVEKRDGGGLYPAEAGK